MDANKVPFQLPLRNDYRHSKLRALDGGYSAIATIPDEDHAAYIVRAVNNFGDMLAALERLTKVAAVELDKTRPDVMDQARAAIAKAKL